MATENWDPAESAGLVPDFDNPDFERTVIGQKADVLLELSLGLRLRTPSAEVALQLSPVLIGRDSTCGLQLPSRMVSRYHAVIYKSGKHHLIRDLNSTNGVLLNGIRVSRSVIRAGDVVQVGDQRLQLVQGPPIQQQYAQECVVIFLDLENSTALSERYGDSFSQAMQQQMLLLEDQLLTMQGTPIKVLGDGLMCAFGLWPVATPGYQPVDQALRFAWQAVRQFRELPGYSALRLRVGLHWGPVVVSERPDLDLFGDTVNLAARLEDCNKHYGTQIMVSSELRSRSRLEACLREVDTVRVHGKDEAVTIYTWDEVFTQTRSTAHREAYQKALDAYRRGDFQSALTYLEAGPAQDVLGQRLKQRLTQCELKPPASWDGAWSLTKGG